MSFGFHRAEVIGALVSVIMIWVVTAVLVYMAILRTITPDFELDSVVMLISSALGILVNFMWVYRAWFTSYQGSSVIPFQIKSYINMNMHINSIFWPLGAPQPWTFRMGCTLHDHGHSHSNLPTTSPHSHVSSEVTNSSHQHSHQNMNVRAAMIHVISDFVQSCGVFIAAVVIFFKPEWNIIDPICTFLFSILVLFTTLNIMKDAILVSAWSSHECFCKAWHEQSHLMLDGKWFFLKRLFRTRWNRRKYLKLLLTIYKMSSKFLWTFLISYRRYQEMTLIMCYADWGFNLEKWSLRLIVKFIEYLKLSWTCLGRISSINFYVSWFYTSENFSIFEHSNRSSDTLTTKSSLSLCPENEKECLSHWKHSFPPADQTTSKREHWK